MSEDSSLRLYALRVLERVQLRDLERTRRWIATEEQRAAEETRAAERRERLRPPPPAWVATRGIGTRREPTGVHVGGCYMATGMTMRLTREQAVRLLADGVEACGHCRPDTELGVLD
ncbi:DUF6233 domain-containing protein [Streptomyces odonnellii]|uniref:DUF6233 domain-containing protein n=1 Tax=Streptomyces odonnellii TaxID=1417980 RepID=UPI0006264958|nr:DUF6233 domain-containing protein [Streptomyces odonnellii]